MMLHISDYIRFGKTAAGGWAMHTGPHTSRYVYFHKWRGFKYKRVLVYDFGPDDQYFETDLIIGCITLMFEGYANG
jgi:hypothetical protein